MKASYNTFSFVQQILGIFILGIFFLPSCSGKLSTHGTLNLENHINNVLKNNMEKAEVEVLLGPPSAKSTFDENKWYYISNQIFKVGIYKPDMIRHQVYEIVFDVEDHAIDIIKYDLSDTNEIEYNKEKTTTRGNESTILDKLIRSKKTTLQ